MSNLLLALLVIAVAFLVAARRRLRRHREALQRLGQSLARRQTFLGEEEPGVLGLEFQQLCGTANDLVTGYNRLTQFSHSQLAQIDTTLGSLKEAVMVLDEQNRIVLANGALHAIFPRSRGGPQQRLELVMDSREFLDYVTAVRAGDAPPQQEVEFLENGSSLWVEATGALIPAIDQSAGTWTLFVLHDVTRQKKLEGLRREFVANVSHELRTPLSVIKGYVETLVDGHRDLPVEDREKFLLTIQRHTERLNSILEDLLTLSRLESTSPGLKVESANPAALITGVVEDVRRRPAAAGHELVLRLDPGVGELALDTLKFTQVLENLIDNALKYTPRGSTVEVQARPVDTGVEVCVRDNGPGIPAEDLTRIFERFYRVDKGRSREKGGTGLGLSIVKHIVQLHGGRVWAESEPGKGAAFFLRLPRRTA
jgi:two-component system phosphate regulon sensor histidine kinase PhoR